MTSILLTKLQSVECSQMIGKAQMAFWPSIRFYGYLAISFPAIAFGADPSDRMIDVKAYCAIYGTRIAAPYEGRMDREPQNVTRMRQMAFLQMSKAAATTSISEWTTNLGGDLAKFGASRIQSPSEITLITIEDLGGGRFIGYGNGDIGGGGSMKFEVQVACDLEAATHLQQ